MFQTRTDIEDQSSQQKRAPFYMRHGKQILKVIFALFLFATFYSVFHLVLGSFKPRGESNVKGKNLLENKDKILDGIDNEQSSELITTKAHQQMTRDIATVDGYVELTEPIPIGNGTNVDIACSRTNDMALIVWEGDWDIQVQPFNTSEFKGNGNKIIINGINIGKKKVVDLSNNDFVLPYWSGLTLRAKMLNPNGTQSSDIYIYNEPVSHNGEVSVTSYEDGFFVERASYLNDRMGHLFDNYGNSKGGVVIASGSGNHYSGAIAARGNSIIDVYDTEQASLNCRFINSSDSSLSGIYTLTSPGQFDGIYDHDVIFGKENEILVAYTGVNNSEYNFYVQVGFTDKTFFINGNFSQPILVPMIWMSRNPALTYVGTGQNGHSLFDISGLTGGGRNIRCELDGSGGVNFSIIETITPESMDASCTTITRSGDVLRGIGTADRRIQAQLYACTPDPCLQIPVQSSSSSIQKSSSEISNSEFSFIVPSASVSQLPFSLASSSERKGNGAVIASVVVIGSTIVAAGIVASGVFYWRRCRNKGQEFDGIALKGKMPVEFGSVIGQGGFGTVLRGIWIAASKKDGPQNGETIAIKELPEKLTELPEMLAEFRNEAELMQRCDHPNIIRCYDFFISPRCCIVMPLFPKGSLAPHAGIRAQNCTHYLPLCRNHHKISLDHQIHFSTNFLASFFSSNCKSLAY